MTETPITFSVVATDDAPAQFADDTAPTARPSSAALLSLKSRREEIKKDLYIDLQVPRWSTPEVFVRYGPIDATRADQAIRKREGSKEFSVLANADILAQACIGVYACLDGDRDTKYSLNSDNPDGPWTRFDPALARNLGLITDAAVDVVRALYYTDGDLIQAAAALGEWSGKTNAKLDEDFSTP